MTSQELEVHQPTTSLGEVMDYARAVSVANMLPDTYRGKPADIMLAVGLGQSMGLSPAESLYRISVIKGKPTASAELIAANVRKAGHKLRVTTDEQAKSVTATILRADDPEFPFEVTRDLTWAQSMGLAQNDNYKKQPLTMLQWRAITAVARLACPEALYGVIYSPDEVEVDRAAITTTVEVVPSGADRMRDMLGTQTGDGAAVAADSQPDPAPSSPPITAPQLKKLHTMLGKVGLGTEDKRDDALAYYARVTGTIVDTSKDLTKVEANLIIDDLERADKGEPSALGETADPHDPADPWAGGGS